MCQTAGEVEGVATGRIRWKNKQLAIQGGEMRKKTGFCRASPSSQERMPPEPRMVADTGTPVLVLQGARPALLAASVWMEFCKGKPA